jgi:hypothetical protein
MFNDAHPPYRLWLEKATEKAGIERTRGPPYGNMKMATPLRYGVLIISTIAKYLPNVERIFSLWFVLRA